MICTAIQKDYCYRYGIDIIENKAFSSNVTVSYSIPVTTFGPPMSNKEDCYECYFMKDWWKSRAEKETNTITQRTIGKNNENLGLSSRVIMWQNLVVQDCSCCKIHQSQEGMIPMILIPKIIAKNEPSSWSLQNNQVWPKSQKKKIAKKSFWLGSDS